MALPAPVAASGGQLLFSESFAEGTTAAPVTALSASAGLPCLTAGSLISTSRVAGCGVNPGDTDGTGVLRLTNALVNQASGIVYDTSLPLAQGLSITFDQYQYGGTGADGISFVLAVAPPQPSSFGAYGGGLGYTVNNADSSTQGMPAGWLGVGLDVFGNFTNTASDGPLPGAGGATCATPSWAGQTTVPNQVTVRGPGNGRSGYCLLSSSVQLSPNPMSTISLRGSSRASAKRNVRVVIDPGDGPHGRYTVSIDPTGAGTSFTTVTSGELPTAYFDPVNGWSSGTPARITFGFAGSTGAATDIHEIGNVTAATLNGAVPVLGLTKTDSALGAPPVGGSFDFVLQAAVVGGTGGGDETQPTTIRVTDPMPSGLTITTTPTGTSWNCAGSTAAAVACTYTATGTISPGTALPPITVPVVLDPQAVPGAHITNVASVTSADAAQPASASDDLVPVAATGSITSNLSADQTTVAPGALTVPIAALPPSFIGGIPGDTAAGAIASTPISSIDVRSQNNVSSTPLSSIPLSSIPISSIPISSIPLSSIGGLKAAPLSSIGLHFPAGCTAAAGACTGWAGLLAGTGLAISPLQSLSLYDVLANPTTQSRLAALTLGDLDLASTPLSSIPISSIMLAGTPISSIRLPGSTGATTVPDWCGLLATLGHSCSSLGIDPDAPSTFANVTLFTLALAGVPISSIPLSSIPLSSIDLGSTPLSSIPLSSIDLAATPLSSIPLSSIPISSIPLSSIPLSSIPISSIPLSSIPLSSIANAAQLVTCLPSCTTLGDAFTRNAFTIDARLGALTDYNGTTLGQLGTYGGALLRDLVNRIVAGQVNPWLQIYLQDILRGLLSRADYPWEALDLAAVPLQAFASSGGVIHLHESISVTADGALPVTVALTLPAGYRYVPGQSSLVHPDGHTTTPLADPTGTPMTFSLLLTQGTWTVDADVQPGITLGPGQVGMSAVVGSGPPPPVSVPITVADPGGHGTPASAKALAPDTLNLDYLTSSGDLDFWTLDVPDGMQLSVSLSNLPADYDLVLYSPPLVPLRGAPEQVLPPIPDPDASLTPGLSAQSSIPTGDVPLDPARAVYALSTRRGTADETINTSSLPGGSYLLQVSGYNGAFGNEPYALRAKLLPASNTAGVCTARTFTNPGAPAGSAPSIPAGVNTLFVVNSQRLSQMYGATDASRVMAALATTAAATTTGVVGAVVDVSSSAAVRNAYAAWDTAAGRCSVAAANAVVTAVAGVVDTIRAGQPTVANIVIVGADDQIPMARVPDTTTLSNERDEAATMAGNNALVAALAGGNVLTDDPYANRTPLGVGAGSLFLPEVALGRLVETPGQIAGALDRFVASGGVLTATKGLSTGYDFLTSAGQAVASALQFDLRNVSGAQVAQLINDTWTRNDLLGAMTNAPVPGLASVNAHFDQSRALPAIGNTTGNQSDLLQTGDIRSAGATRLAGTLLFSMGCHSGLNVPDTEVGGVNDTWAKTFADQGALWVANTGFGYGDTSSVALSARLMVEFAKRLDGAATIGRALALAKQQYAADSATVDAYDMKALMESTLYGLPMYRLNVGPTPPPPPAPQPLATGTDPVTGLAAASVTITPAFQLVSTPTGDYFTVNGKSDAAAYRPIEPLATVDVTQRGTTPGSLGLVAHGALITSLVTADRAPFNPAYATPVVDAVGTAPPGGAGDDSYPAAPQRVATYIGPDGTRQQLSLVVGQFLGGPPAAGGGPGPGTQRLFSSIGAVVYYDPAGSAAAADWSTPAIVATIATRVGGAVSFSVDATDAGGAASVRRVVVLYTDADHPGTWTTLDLVRSASGAWTGSGAATASGRVSYIVQAVDAAGNVGVSSNKAVGHQAVVPQSTPGLSIQLASAPAPVNGFYQAPVTVTVDPATDVAVSIDGGSFASYTGPVVVDGAGLHHVVARRGAGGTAESLFAIDKAAPAALLAAPVAGTYVVGQVVTADYRCSDDESGIASCAGAVVAPGGATTSVANGARIDTSKPGTFTFRVTATDRVGRTAVTTAAYTVTYGVCPLPSGGKANQKAVVSVTLCSPAGANLSAKNIVLTAVSVDNTLPAPPTGPPNPTRAFFYVGVGPFSMYSYALDARHLAPGVHTLQFRVAGDSVLHSVPFVLL